MTPAIPLANEPRTKPRGAFLLACEATKDGERVLLLEAFGERDGHVTVVAETWSVKSRVRLDPVRSAYRFRTEAEATKFVDEAMIALEYLGCTVTMHSDDHPGAHGPPPGLPPVAL